MNIPEIKQKALNISRVTLAVVVAANLIWLTWWVLPDLAFITLAPKGSSMPWTGYIVKRYLYGRFVEIWTVNRFITGWWGCLAGWPYVFIGILGGLSVGYVVGEFTRRKFAIEEITKEKEAELKEKIDSAEEKEGKTIQMLALAFKWREEMEETAKTKSAQEGEQAQPVGAKVQQQHTGEEKVKKELLNARDKIRRQDAKIEGLEKTIDEMKKSP